MRLQEVTPFGHESELCRNYISEDFPVMRPSSCLKRKETVECALLNYERELRLREQNISGTQAI